MPLQIRFFCQSPKTSATTLVPLEVSPQLIAPRPAMIIAILYKHISTDVFDNIFFELERMVGWRSNIAL